MKCMGVDYGTKNIGVAISDDRGAIAFPRAVITNDEKIVRSLLTLATDEGVQLIVVGDTRTGGGAENTITKAAEEFVADLSRGGIPVELVPESWSSQEAARFAPPGSPHNDAAAAAVILQRYLDMHPRAVE
ncbi:MAG: pre-16S rRNA-processing nuclease YqgF [Candidatus Kaiserbacteria bacterium]|nr:MAG: pre-16S rRNA-processing nuclease YqgF [Candidatus Kaiserbacteria bacterium]